MANQTRLIQRPTRLWLLAAVSAVLCAGSAAPQWFGRFSEADTEGWAEHSFSGQTQYRLRDAGDGTALEAVSEGTASAFYKESQVDLTKTPVLHWRWRVDHGPSGLDEHQRDGDDYAARVYVLHKRGVLRKPYAINYVWSGSQARGASWPNAWLPEHSMMVAVRGSDDARGQWFNESRNVLDDFKNLLGVEIDRADVLVLMSDTDNQRGSARAWFGDSYFSKD